MTVVAKKVWCPSLEPEPSELYNKSSCPNAPEHWFKEEPELAANLYVLELHGQSTNSKEWKVYYVNVLDSDEKFHRFCFKAGYELTVYKIKEDK